MRPVRLQASRARGFDLQKLSLAANRLPAVYVARPSKWGNPFRVGDGQTRSQTIAAYRSYVLRSALRQQIGELRGKNLACWCKPGEPCHADVLLKLANK
jgi:hypothetical protein